MVLELNGLTKKYEILCLQETWLDKSEVNVLSNSFLNFPGFGISKTAHESGITLGRKSGGLGIIWNKQKVNAKCLHYDEHWVQGINTRKVLPQAGP